MKLILSLSNGCNFIKMRPVDSWLVAALHPEPWKVPEAGRRMPGWPAVTWRSSFGLALLLPCALALLLGTAQGLFLETQKWSCLQVIFPLFVLLSVFGSYRRAPWLRVLGLFVSFLLKNSNSTFLPIAEGFWVVCERNVAWGRGSCLGGVFKVKAKWTVQWLELDSTDPFISGAALLRVWCLTGCQVPSF